MYLDDGINTNTPVKHRASASCLLLVENGTKNPNRFFLLFISTTASHLHLNKRRKQRKVRRTTGWWNLLRGKETVGAQTQATRSQRNAAAIRCLRPTNTESLVTRSQWKRAAVFSAAEYVELCRSQRLHLLNTPGTTWTIREVFAPCVASCSNPPSF